MTETLMYKAYYKDIENFFREDDLQRNLFYIDSLPKDLVKCQLNIKSDLLMSGLPFFFACFSYLTGERFEVPKYSQYEGQSYLAGDKFEIEFEVPFAIALTAERIALNLLQRCCSISTYTSKLVSKAKDFGITILDTRKTTPGLRSIEKYAVRLGGGSNHRFGQSDVWMIKDNHKEFFGGLEKALEYFKSMHAFYNPIVVEIHSIEQLKQAVELGISHIMLDNFSREEIEQAILLKTSNMTYEISGGVRLENLDRYLIEGVDAISVGAVTYDCPSVDLSFKYKKR